MLRPQFCKGITHPDLTAKSWKGFVAEPKHDGMRALVFVGSESVGPGLQYYVDMFSRAGKSQKGKFPHLEEVFGRLMPPGTVLDGELAFVAEKVDLFQKTVPIVDFNRTMRVCGSGPAEAVTKQRNGGEVSFILFDILRWGSEDYIDKPLSERRKKLEDICQQLLDNGNAAEHVILNPQWYAPSNLPKLCSAVEGIGCEGLVLKRRDRTYVPGGRPNQSWYKVKKFATFDVVCMGFTPGTGKYSGQIGALRFGAYDETGQLAYVAKCSGMDDAMRKWMSDNQRICIGRVLVVKSNDTVGSGKYLTPRHPNFMHWRDERMPGGFDPVPPRECSMEQFLKETP